ncbi:hypothetical protein ACLMAB_08195 [Brevibacillus laterosporus]
MFKAVRVTSIEMKEEFCSLAGPSANRIDTLNESNADAHWMILDNEGVAARCSLWWSNVPPYQDHQVGVIGHYAARNSAAAVELLQLSSRELEKRDVRSLLVQWMEALGKCTGWLRKQKEIFHSSLSRIHQWNGQIILHKMALIR